VLSLSANLNLLRFRDNSAAANAIATVFVTSTNKIGIRDDVTTIAKTSQTRRAAQPRRLAHRAGHISSTDLEPD
jgi:hypothetical protein